jgi:hypothetical protein
MRTAWQCGRLPFLDRWGGLFGRRGRQRWRRAFPLRLRIGLGRLRCYPGWPRAGRRRLGGRGRPGFRARRRLQGWRRLRDPRIVHGNLGQRNAGQSNPRRDHDGCQQQIVPVTTLSIVRRHSVHRSWLVRTQRPLQRMVPRGTGLHSPTGGSSFPTAISKLLVQRMGSAKRPLSISMRPSYSARFRSLCALRKICTSELSEPRV